MRKRVPACLLLVICLALPAGAGGCGFVRRILKRDRPPPEMQETIDRDLLDPIILPKATEDIVIGREKKEE